MFAYDIKIPRERIAVLIGADGEVKQLIEQQTKTRLVVDSKEGDVNVSGNDAVLLYAAQHIVKAIARGFNPDIALRLLKQDWVFELIDLTNYSTKQNHQQRLKGRIIGTQGRSRAIIEELADASISVYGKTVAIIAPVETMGMAKQAVEDLLSGSQHAGVYKSLERKRRQLRMTSTLGTSPRDD